MSAPQRAAITHLGCRLAQFGLAQSQSSLPFLGANGLFAPVDQVNIVRDKFGNDRIEVRPAA
jgi:hypothetical protein